jgi:mannosyltransferase OCH1-like enzyme
MTTASSSIPHVIYFFWDHVGKVLPSYARKNIATWHSFFPDYQIKAITNLDFEPSMMPFTKKAYEAKRYGYAVDYIRLAFLYQHGGLYFDLEERVLTQPWKR